MQKLNERYSPSDMPPPPSTHPIAIQCFTKQNIYIIYSPLAVRYCLICSDAYSLNQRMLHVHAWSIHLLKLLAVPLSCGIDVECVHVCVCMMSQQTANSIIHWWSQ